MATITIKIESDALARQVIESLFSLECTEVEMPEPEPEPEPAPEPPVPEVPREEAATPWSAPEPIDNGFGTSIEEIDKENRF